MAQNMNNFVLCARSLPAMSKGKEAEEVMEERNAVSAGNEEPPKVWSRSESPTPPSEELSHARRLVGSSKNRFFFSESQRAILRQHKAECKPAEQKWLAFFGAIAHKIDRLAGGRPGTLIVCSSLVACSQNSARYPSLDTRSARTSAHDGTVCVCVCSRDRGASAKTVDAEAVRNWFYGQERGQRGPSLRTHPEGIRVGKFARSGQPLVHLNVQQHAGVPLNRYFYNEAQRRELKKVT
jgi:hypothetical protein